MGRRKRGPISKKIKRLWNDLRNGKIDESTFKEEIRAIIKKYGKTGYVFQGIGMAIQKWCGSDERVWRLVDEVDITIRKQLENWRKKCVNKLL
jgi:hypothetical protein